MTTARELLSEIDDIFRVKWDERTGRKVPEPEDIRLGNDAVTLQGTVLYADMTQSTELVNNFKAWFAAEVYKAYLTLACRLVRNNDGVITAFDGDRVMAVFVGNGKNTAAARTALQINWGVEKINEKLKTAYPKSSYKLRHTIGIDTSELFVARTGIREYNDLVWVGSAANYAAKLAAMPEDLNGAWITEAVFKALGEDAKYGGSPRSSMWERSHWKEFNRVVYRSEWEWKPT